MRYKSHRTATVHHGEPGADGRPELDCGTRIGRANRLETTNRPVNCGSCLNLDTLRNRYIECVHNGGTASGPHQVTQKVAVARWDAGEEEWRVFGYDRGTGDYWDRFGTLHYDPTCPGGGWYVHSEDPVDGDRRLVYPKGVEAQLALYWPITDVPLPRGIGAHKGFMQAVTALLGRPPQCFEYYRISKDAPSMAWS